MAIDDPPYHPPTCCFACVLCLAIYYLSEVGDTFVFANIDSTVNFFVYMIIICPFDDVFIAIFNVALTNANKSLKGEVGDTFALLQLILPRLGPNFMELHFSVISNWVAIQITAVPKQSESVSEVRSWRHIRNIAQYQCVCNRSETVEFR